MKDETLTLNNFFFFERKIDSDENESLILIPKNYKEAMKSENAFLTNGRCNGERMIMKIVENQKNYSKRH